MSDAPFALLNDAERRVLRLLAEGHTIKSAASLIGSTPDAINERLREARRKTGMGSSRELARKLRTHENCHRQFGVEAGCGGASPTPTQGASPWRSNKGVTIMLFAGLAIAAAGAAALVSQGAPDDAAIDPIIGAPLPDGRSGAEWQALLRTEKRDASWANDGERVLRDRYARISHLGGEQSPVRVRCAATICEVAGVIAAEAGADSSREDVVNRTMAVLQGKELADGLLGQGLKWETTLFTSTDADPTQPAFFSYYTRVEA